jgi:hypothetical protein
MTASIILKKSSVAARVPVAGDLQYGELALNYADGALYYKRSDNTVQNLISSGGAGGTSAIDFKTYTATAGQTTFSVAYTPELVNVYVNGVRLSNADYTASSGTSVVLASACLAGDVVNLVGFTSLQIGYGLPSQTGNTGKFLTTNGTEVSWGTVSGTGTVTSVAATVPAFLSVSGSPITSSGTLAITLSGTALPAANGGTGATSLAGASIATYTGTETLTNKTLTAPVLNSVSSFSLRDTAAAHDLTIRSTSNIPLTFARTLTIDVNNANWTLDINGNITTGNNFTTAVGPITLSSAGGGSSVVLPQSGTLATLAGTEALSNKRITPRVISAASASTLTPDIASGELFVFTALAANLSISAPTGTPVDGDKITIRILDNGTSRTLTWNATYTPIGVTLPTATTINKTTYVGCVYNANNTRWDVIAVATQS